MTQYNPKRVRERLDLRLPVRVHCRETPDFEWTEITRLTNVTPFGCGFTLKRPTERGRLLHMTIPMPRQLRVFDHVEDQYRVWALVRYFRTLESASDKGPLFEAGVAFIGKHPPRSYEEDPSRRYEIAPSFSETLTLAEDLAEDADENTAPVSSSDQRVQTRHNMAIEILLEVLDEEGDVGSSESTVTENISNKGATLFTSLAISVGRFVRLRSQQYNVTVYAAVRARSTGADGIPRIHVEFIEKEWPL
ncbi:MAG: hypothetical protein ACRD6N_19215 [Pyrinomonadaceae bacterium]